MKSEEFKLGMDHDLAMEVGQDCVVRWTNSHRYFRAKGVISKLNKKSVRVTLKEQVDSSLGCYPVGHNITVPRFINIQLWSPNNCVEPWDFKN